MGRLEACRICLITNVKLERIQGSLENDMKSVFGHNVMCSSDMPEYACYECSALLAKFNKFKKKYFTAQSLLFNILQNNGVVTENEIKKIDRKESKLDSNLSVAHIEGHTQYFEVKIECDPMEGIPDMTEFEEINESGSEDDAPLNSISKTKNANKKPKNKPHTSPRKNNNMISENVSGEPSSKVQKLQGVNTRNTDGAESNGAIFLQEDFVRELTDMDNTFEEHSPSSAISMQILENQNIMINNQNTILSKLANFSAIVGSCNNINTSYPNQDLLQDKSFVIENKKQLDELENDLNDPEKKTMLRNKYAILFKGKGEGITCAYILMDALFSRKFLTTCSWTGGSRGEDTKIPIKAYRNIINFIYEVVQDCDRNFSLLDCYNFIKNLLRNSVKRLQSKRLRMSTARRRAKRVSLISELEIYSDTIKPNEQTESTTCLL